MMPKLTTDLKIKWPEVWKKATLNTSIIICWNAFYQHWCTSCLRQINLQIVPDIALRGMQFLHIPFAIEDGRQHGQRIVITLQFKI